MSENLASGALADPDIVSSSASLVFRFILAISFLIVLFVVFKPTRRGNRQPIEPARYRGIGNVSSVHHINSEYAHQGMYAMTQSVYEINHNSESTEMPLPVQGIWTPANQCLQVPSGDVDGASGAAPQHNQVAPGPHPQRRQPSSATLRAFTHRSQQ